jgi:hypothetical protein
VPVTLTLDITDLVSGEVFTRTRTDMSHGLRQAAGLEARVAAELPGMIGTAMESLVAQAASEFALARRPQRCWAMLTWAEGSAVMCWTRVAPPGCAPATALARMAA